MNDAQIVNVSNALGDLAKHVARGPSSSLLFCRVLHVVVVVVLSSSPRRRRLLRLVAAAPPRDRAGTDRTAPTPNTQSRVGPP